MGGEEDRELFPGGSQDTQFLHNLHIVGTYVE